MSYTETFEDTCFKYEASGFKKYDDPFLKQQLSDGIKLSSYQKKISDEHGIMYFVNVHVYDLSKMTKGIIGVKQELDVQFHTQDNMSGEYVNIKRSVNSPSEAINQANEMWFLLKCGYYERN